MTSLCKKESYSFEEVAEYFKISFSSLFYHMIVSKLNVTVYINVDNYLQTPLLVSAEDPYIYPSGLYYIDKANLVELYYDNIDYLKIDYIHGTSAFSYDEVALSIFDFPDYESLYCYYGDEICDFIDDNLDCDDFNELDYVALKDEFTINNKNLRILYKDLIKFEQDVYPQIEKISLSNNTKVNIENILTASKLSKNTNRPSLDKKIGGRPQGPLAEAIEKVFIKLRQDGHYVDLEERNIRGFLLQLRTLSSKKLKMNGSNDVPDLIKEVKISVGTCYVATEDYYLTCKKGRETKIPGRKYPVNEVSKLLCKFRKKYPIPK